MKRKLKLKRLPRPNHRFYILIMIITLGSMTFSYFTNGSSQTVESQTQNHLAEIDSDRNVALNMEEGIDINSENGTQEKKDDSTALSEGENEFKPRTGKVAYITIDDGPSPYTDSFIELFNQFNVNATFFMIGENIVHHTEAVKKMAEDGFGIGLHSMSHSVKKVYSSLQNIVSEMEEERQIVQNLTGIDSTLIRTPYGSKPYLSNQWKNSIEAKGYKIWDWNIDSKDWKNKSGRMVDIVKKEVKELELAKIDPVILFHDTQSTLEHMDEVITYLLNENYELRAIDESLTPLTW
ncbi:polysaccharide deacetylase family protein [Bacillus sp. 2205SS5-2]|uniref:polysaccharide deacetylase family protein n=1 Tax=Bacillus sp. 2205SS5-2 TaxID=3109031 RepID=UPI003005A7E4